MNSSYIFVFPTSLLFARKVIINQNGNRFLVRNIPGLLYPSDKMNLKIFAFNYFFISVLPIIILSQSTKPEV